MNHASRDNLVFYSVLTAVILFFCWSRFDSSNRIYYFGDGNAVVAATELILQGNSWDQSVEKLILSMSYQTELAPLADPPKQGQHYYNFSSFVMIIAAFCKLIYKAGLTSLSVQQIIHGFNMLCQALTLCLLYFCGRHIQDKWTGLIAMVFFTAFPLAVMEAHYERHESWFSLLGISLIFCALQFRRAPRSFALLIGVLTGFAIAAKISHVYLGLIPALLLLRMHREQLHARWLYGLKDPLVCGVLVLAGIFLALYVNVPFVLMNLDSYFAELSSIQGFYQQSHYPYGLEHYSYWGQFKTILSYFFATLGWPWMLLTVLGGFVLLSRGDTTKHTDRTDGLMIIAPILFLLCYFAGQTSFTERHFATVEGGITLLTAIGIIRIARIQRAFLLPVIVAALVIPMTINVNLVTQYLRQPVNNPRQDFELPLKEAFHGFWIKNVYHSYNALGVLPEKPPKAPRLYKVEDLNEHWSRDYVAKLQVSGFTRVALYCSEFAQLPPNNLTIYHSAAKYHYFVRNDEWPAAVAKDYFLSNCQ